MYFWYITVTAKTTAQTGVMKEIFVPQKLALIFNLLVPGLATVFLTRGDVMEIMTVLIIRMKKVTI